MKEETTREKIETRYETMGFVIRIVTGIVLSYGTARYALIGGLYSSVILCVGLAAMYFYPHTWKCERQFVYGSYSLEELKRHVRKGYWRGEGFRQWLTGSVLSARKGCFFLQINAMFQILVLLITEFYFYSVYNGVFGDYRRYSAVRSGLFFWVLGGLILYVSFLRQYRVILQHASEDRAEAMRLWDVFTLPEACAGTEKYPCLCNDYEKIKNRATQYHLNKTICFCGGNKLDGSTEQLNAAEENGKLKVFMVVYYDKLMEEDLDDLNLIIQEWLNQGIRSERTVLPIRLTYLICVKKNSRAFHRLISGVSQQDKDRYVLPAGIVFDEKMLYLSRITGNPEIKMQKQELFEILGL